MVDRNVSANGAGSAPDLSIALSSDTGPSSTDAVTASATLIGNTDPGTTITFQEGSTALGSTSSSNGTYRFTPSLADGAHTITATATNGFGTSTANINFTLDRASPTVTTDLGLFVATGTTRLIDPGQLKSDDSISTHAQETYLISAGPSKGTIVINGTPVTRFTQDDVDAYRVSYQETDPRSSSDSFNFQVTDAAGNLSASRVFQIGIRLPLTVGLYSDTGALATDNVSAESSLAGTKSSQSTLTFTEGPTTLITYTSGTSGWIANPTNVNGLHTVTVTQSADEFGSSSITITYLYDSIAPTIAANSPLVVRQTTAGAIGPDLLRFEDNTSVHTQEVYTVVAAPANGTLLKFGSAVTFFTQDDIDNGRITYQETARNVSTDNFRVTVADLSGNVSRTQTFQIQIAPSVTEQLFVDTGASASDNYTNSAAVTGLADAGASVTISENSTVLGTASVNSSGYWIFGPTLPDGRHTLTVSETNSIGLSGSASLTFTLDRGAPTQFRKNALVLPQQTTATIGFSILRFDDGLSATAQETYTVISAPTRGTLLRNGVAASSFTQADIDAGLVAYRETAVGATSDGFVFTVSDAAGNTTAQQIFSVQILLPPAVTIALVSDTGMSAADNVSSNPVIAGGGDANATVTISEGTTVLGTTVANGSGTYSFMPSVADGVHTLTASETNSGGTATASVGLTLDRSAPRLVTDSRVTLIAGANATIGSDLLRYDDAIESHAQETYRLVSGPARGVLLRNGAPATSFTQADIDNGLVSYLETVRTASSDSFVFQVSDAAGNVAGAATFGIQVFPASNADYNADGTGDVLFRNGTDGQASGINGRLTVATLGGGSFTGYGLPIGVDSNLPGGHGDIDGNGYADVALQDPSTGAITIAYQNGSGAPGIVTPTAAPGSRVVGVGDVNGDGFADIVVQNQVSGAVATYNARTNGFTAVTTPAGFTVVGVGDVNGDGFADMVVENYATGQIQYLNMAGGAFAGTVNVTTTPGWDVRAVGDLNGDGFADIAIQQEGSGQNLFANMAGGTFNGYGMSATPLTPDYLIADAVDVNRDGFADLIVQQLSTGTTFYAQEGASGFVRFGTVTPPGATPVNGQYQVAGNGATLARTAALSSDVDGDGTGDVIFRDDQSGQLSFLTIRAGVPVASTPLTAGVGGFAYGGSGDFNHDGRADFVLNDTATGNVYVGTPSLTASPTPGYGIVGTFPGNLVKGVGDITRDHYADIVLQNATDRSVAYLDPRTGQLAGVLGATAYTVVGVGDVNGDGYADIVLQDQAVTANIAYVDMAGGQPRGLVNVGTTPGFVVRAVADLNGDGYADVVLQDGSGQAVYADMKGGSFNRYVSATPQMNSDYIIRDAADLFNDGHADLVIQQISTGTTLFAQEGASGFLGFGPLANQGTHLIAV